MDQETQEIIKAVLSSSLISGAVGYFLKAKKVKRKPNTYLEEIITQHDQYLSEHGKRLAKIEAILHINKLNAFEASNE